MLFEKVKSQIITFYFKTSTVDVGECIQPQQHWSKQHSKVVTPQEKVAFHHSIFCQGISSFVSFANEVTHLKFFTIHHLTVSLYSYYFNTGHLH